MTQYSHSSEDRYGLWLDYVRSVAELFATGISLPIGPTPLSDISPDISITFRPVSRVLICSPHPDDEGLVGALPLRLRLEDGAQVTNCAITLGSDTTQRPRRLAEVQASCRMLGFELIVARAPNGLDPVTSDAREHQKEEWSAKVQELAEIFDSVRPDLVLFPHKKDFHKTHIGTHLLAVDALRIHLSSGSNKRVLTAQSEYWQPMSNPNLMIGVTLEAEAVLVMAVAEHGGEVSRNPYHVLHPARLIENVRRGSEVVGGSGAPAVKFQFAELYRILPATAEQDSHSRTSGLIVDPAQRLTLATLREKFDAKEQ